MAAAGFSSGGFRVDEEHSYEPTSANTGRRVTADSHKLGKYLIVG